jgi:alkylation response protein AidB-like acyl-CoA dehydrogenase
MPGFRVGKKENKLGMRASATGEVLFTDCKLPQTQLLGKQGEGFVDSLRILDGGRISIAALSLGIAQGAFDAALKYSKTAQTIWPFYFRISGDPGQASQYGDRHRSRPLAHLSRRANERRGQTRH